MLTFEHPLPDWVEQLLGNLPEYPYRLLKDEKFQSDTFRIEVRCGAWTVSNAELGALKSSFQFSHAQVYHCRKPKFVLWLTVTRRSKRPLFFSLRLPSTQNSQGFEVIAEKERVRRWVKNAHLTVSRIFSRKRSYKPRTTRPNPEETFGQKTYFLQRADNIQVLTTEPVLLARRTWTGTTTPGFKTIRRRDLPINNHSVDLQVNRDDGYINVYKRFDFPQDDTVYIRSFSLGHGIAGIPFPDHLGNSTELAIQRLVDRMGQNLEGNLAQDMAQFGQTSRLITDAAQRIVRSLSALRRKDFLGAVSALWHGKTRGPRFKDGKGAPTFSNSLADNWLALQYGWKPLLQDIRGSMDSLAKFYQLSEHVARTVSASAKKESTSTQDLLDHIAHTHVIGYGVNRVQTRVKFVLRYRIDSRLKAFLSQTGFTNPINLIWEVLPYSFVADWLIPVGSWLQQSSNYDGLEFLDGSHTLFTIQNYSGVINSIGPYAPMDPRDQNWEFGKYERTRVILNRYKLNSFPTSNPPGFKNPLSMTHALNSIALVKSAFGR